MGAEVGSVTGCSETNEGTGKGWKGRALLFRTAKGSTAEYNAYSSVSFTSPAGRVVTSRGSFFKSA